MLLRVLRFVDISLGVTLTLFIAFYLVTKTRAVRFEVKDFTTVLLAFLFIGTTYAAIDFATAPSHTKRLGTTGVFTQNTGGVFGVYFDVTGANTANELDWGTLEPGGNATREIWVKNEDVVPIVLSISTEGWEPVEASNYLNVTWDFGDTPLYPSMSRRVRITLTVDESITGIYNFSFDIMLSS